MERKPPRQPDGFSSSRPANRGPKRPRGEGDARPPRRDDGDNRFRERGDRGEGRFDSRGPRGGHSDGPRGRNDSQGGRDFGDRPQRPARAEWQNSGENPRPRFERDDRGPREDRGARDDRGGRFERNDRPGFDRDRPRSDRPQGDRPRSDRPQGDRPRFDRPQGDRPRFERNDRFGDRRPRQDDARPAIDDDAGNRVDYKPRSAPRFDDRRPRKPGFEGGRDGGGRDGGRGDGGPRFRDNERGDRYGRGEQRGDQRGREGQEKPRKERYQVWNKELPGLDESRSDRSTLKMTGKGDVIERKIYGVNACLSFFAQRPQDIIRAYFTEAVARQHFGDVMKFLAQEKLAYHLVPAEDMERVTESTHHEGVCLLVRDQPAESFFHWLETNPTEAAQAQCILALEDIGNPHNVGAILRVAAHFGVKAVVVKDASLARSGAAMRTAEGGAEHVKLVEAEDFERMLATCRREGYTIVSTSSHQGSSLFDQPLPARVVILFGQESKGLSSHLQEGSDLRVRIPGTKQVESLNVSVAAGILLSEYWRNHGV